MCGIGAFQIVQDECEPAKVARVLLRLLEVRGKDASGVAWHADKQTFVRKGACAGKELARVLDKVIGATGIVHTRWATQGTPKNNNNNHPIDVGGIVGVHNGHIANDDALLKQCVNYKRQAQVDSEAVFALIAHGKKETKLVDRLAKVSGTAALLWLRSFDKQERLYAVRLNSSPLWFGQTKLGSIVFASTQAILKEVGKRCKLDFEYMYEMQVGEHIVAQDGIVKHMDKVQVILPKVVALPKHDYTKHSVYSKVQMPYAEQFSFDDEDDLALWNDSFDYNKEQDETNLRDALDRQFRMGKYEQGNY